MRLLYREPAKLSWYKFDSLHYPSVVLVFTLKPVPWLAGTSGPSLRCGGAFEGEEGVAGARGHSRKCLLYSLAVLGFRALGFLRWESAVD